MRQSPAARLLRRQLLPWALTSMWCLVCSFVTFVVVFVAVGSSLTTDFIRNFGATGAATLIGWAALFVAAVATVGQSAGLMVSYLLWRHLSRRRLAAWSTGAAVATVCLVPILFLEKITFPLLERPWVSSDALAGVPFALTVGIAYALSRRERSGPSTDSQLLSAPAGTLHDG